MFLRMQDMGELIELERAVLHELLTDVVRALASEFPRSSLRWDIERWTTLLLEPSHGVEGHDRSIRQLLAGPSEESSGGSNLAGCNHPQR